MTIEEAKAEFKCYLKTIWPLSTFELNRVTDEAHRLYSAACEERVRELEILLHERQTSGWKPADDTMEMSVPEAISHIYKNRLSEAVAPNGHTTPYLSTEEWSRIYEWSKVVAQERHQAEVYRKRMAELESELAGLRRGAVTEATDAYERLDSWARLVCEYLETRPDDEINGAPLLLSIYRERCRALGVTLKESQE